MVTKSIQHLTVSHILRSELTNNDFTETGPRSPLTSKCGHITRTKPFAWTIGARYRVELYIEPWNTSSIHVAEASGYQRGGLLRSHQEIGGTGRDMLLYATTRP
jgi:hypothetical protein